MKEREVQSGVELKFAFSSFLDFPFHFSSQSYRKECTVQSNNKNAGEEIFEGESGREEEN